MPLLLWRRLGSIWLLPLDAGIGALLVPLLAESRGEGGVADGRIRNIGIGRQGHASARHGERCRDCHGGIGGGGRGRWGYSCHVRRIWLLFVFCFVIFSKSDSSRHTRRSGRRSNGRSNWEHWETFDHVARRQRGCRHVWTRACWWW